MVSSFIHVILWITRWISNHLPWNFGSSTFNIFINWLLFNIFNRTTTHWYRARQSCSRAEFEFDINHNHGWCRSILPHPTTTISTPPPRLRPIHACSNRMATPPLSWGMWAQFLTLPSHLKYHNNPLPRGMWAACWFVPDGVTGGDGDPGVGTNNRKNNGQIAGWTTGRTAGRTNNGTNGGCGGTSHVC